MTCSSCGTRIDSNDRNCPNCGRTQTGLARAGAGGKAKPLAAGLSASTAKAPGPRDGLRKTGGRKPTRPVKKKRRARPAEISLDTAADSVAGDDFAGASQIRALLHDRPDSLEAGLRIYTDAGGEPVGIDFTTEVGNIDLLARDDAGGLVLVLIAPAEDPGATSAGKDLVAQALERVGWVRKHIAEPQQEVRAIVLLEQVPKELSYTAAAVASTVGLKTYRMEISFSDVEV